MTDLAIERLTLKLVSGTADDGRRLAQLIVEGLAAAPLPASTGEALASLHLQVTTANGEGTERLAARIVADVLRHLARAEM